jgi:DNA-binding MarR family transcriptional regulator
MRGREKVMSNEITYEPQYDDIDLHLWALLQQVRHIMLRIREKDLVPYDTSEVKVTIMFLISVIGHDATPGEIARWTPHRPHAISTLLDRMEKDGLVRRVKDLKRKSMVRIEITPKGSDILLKLAGLEPIHEIMSALSGEERLQLKVLLLKLREAVCNIAKIDSPLFPPTDIH